jgi:3-oxoacyl-[acyl-carrier protein] reductase
MDLGLTGRTAIVTGATSGLGEAVARALGHEGAQVVVAGRRGAAARAIASELPHAIGVEADITDPDAAGLLVAAAQDAFGAVDVVVLNGGGPPPGTAAAMSGADVAAAVDSLVLPHQRLVSQVKAGMRARQWGRILAIGSSGVLTPIPGLAASNVGRAALGAYLKTLAGEIARDGVTVNMLVPGRIETGRIQQLDTARAQREGKTVPEVVAESLAAIPVGRYGRPEEFAAMAAFLCGERASYITGTAVRCDGGLVPFL